MQERQLQRWAKEGDNPLNERNFSETGRHLAKQAAKQHGGTDGQ